MIIPAILEKDFNEIKKRIDLVESLSKEVQVDVLDNTLIRGETFTDLSKLNELNTSINISIHLMVEKPADFVEKYERSSRDMVIKNKVVDTFITQFVNENDLNSFFDACEKFNYTSGISINYDQDSSLIKPILERVSLVQFMGVIPGKQGNAFIPEVIQKISSFKEDFPNVKTQIDGGVNKQNISEILKSGVDNVAVGSAIFNTSNPKDEMLEFLKILGER
jgi:ribulose-phosphate 3-epimerase